MKSSDQIPGWWGYFGDEMLPNYIGIIVSHCKDPLKNQPV